MSSRRVSRMTDFKVYNVDSGMTDTAISNLQHARATVMAVDGSVAAPGSRNLRSSAVEMGSVLSRGHNDRFYDELDYERKVRKRKARLVGAAEEAFTYIRRQQTDRG